MNQDPDLSPAEATLQAALQTERPPDVPPQSDRHERIEKAVRGHTAAHDVSHLMLGSVFTALGRLLLTLWNLAAGKIDSPKEDPTSSKKDRDDNQS